MAKNASKFEHMSMERTHSLVDEDTAEDFLCDYCGVSCEGVECNLLRCSYGPCATALYHQACLEKFLKGNKLEKNRKTGFKCPRGSGKGSKFSTPCPGRIEKSHPIIPRNEEKKDKKRQAAALDPPPKPPRPDKQAEKEKSKPQREEETKPAPTPAKTKATAAAIAVPTNKPIPARVLASAMKASSKDKAAAADTSKAATSKAGKLGSDVASGRDVSSGKVGSRAAAASSSEPDELPAPPLQAVGLGDLLSIATVGKRRGNKDNNAHANAQQVGHGAAVSPFTRHASSGGSDAAVTPVRSASPQTPNPVKTSSNASEQAWPALPTAATAPSSQLPSILSTSKQASMVTAGSGMLSPPSSSSPASMGSRADSLPTSGLGNGHMDSDCAAVTASAGISNVSSTAAVATLALSTPNGSAFDDEASLPVVSKTMRKKLLRAEKKKKQLGGTVVSTPEPATAAAGDADSAAAGAQRATSAAGGHPPGFPVTPVKQPVTPMPTQQLASISTPGAATTSSMLQRDAVSSHESLQQQFNLKQLESGALCKEGSIGDDGSGMIPAHHLQPSPDDTPVAGQQQQHRMPPPGMPCIPQQPQQHNMPRDTLEELCYNALVTRKCRQVFTQMRRVGFTSWQAVSAVRSAGCNIADALVWLLTHRDEDSAQLASSAAAMPLPVVDITPELAQLAQAQAMFRLPADMMFQAVIHSSGDVGMALASINQQLAAMHGASCGPYDLVHQASLESFYTARSEFTALSRLGTSTSEMGWNTLAESESYAAFYDAQPAQLSATYSHTSLANGHFGMMSHTSSFAAADSYCVGKATPHSNMYGHHGMNGAWGDASSTHESGVYSRMGVNGSTCESLGSAGDVVMRHGAAQALAADGSKVEDAEVDALMALMCS